MRPFRMECTGRPRTHMCLTPSHVQPSGPSVSLYLTLFGIVAGLFSTFWAFGYVRLNRKLRAYLAAGPGANVPRIRKVLCHCVFVCDSGLYGALGPCLAQGTMPGGAACPTASSRYSGPEARIQHSQHAMPACHVCVAPGTKTADGRRQAVKPIDYLIGLAPCQSQ